MTTEGLQAVRIALALAGDKSSARGGERGALPTTPKSGSSKVSLSRSRIGDDCFKNALGATLARHLGRTLQLYGDTTQEQACIDLLLDCMEDIQRKHSILMASRQLYGVRLSAAKWVYWRSVMELAPGGYNGRGHFQVLRQQLLMGPAGGGGSCCGRGGAGDVARGWLCGRRPSIVDVQLFCLIDMHCRLFGRGVLGGSYPELIAFRERFAALPAVRDALGGHSGRQRQGGQQEMGGGMGDGLGHEQRVAREGELARMPCCATTA